MSDQIISAPISPQRARKIYDFASRFYDYFTKYEIGPKKRGLDVAGIKPGHVVLEIGFGTGQILVELARRVKEDGRVCGIDISPKMLEKTEMLLKKHGLSDRVDLQLGDARRLPHEDDVFDVVFNSYMLDLIDTQEIPTVLAEFKRVLKPEGRLVLVNMTKGERGYTNMKLYERIYKQCPSLLGGCRPVLIKPFLHKLGLCNVKREFVLAGHILPSEIVWGEKPKDN
ncbi:MAG: class I SAM-dependent methyltransferase [Candidatus Bathyarchaeia archaeon]